MAKKIKVAAICHFSNEEIQLRLPLKRKVKEFAPWIAATASEIAKRDEIEFHIISPHSHLKEDTYFEENGIHYYFFKYGIPVLNRHWPRFFLFDHFTNFSSNRIKIKKLIREINPDIIHLYGAENAYYSSAILDYLDRPHLITIQGFLYLSNHKDITYPLRKRLEVEKEILRRGKNFGVRYDFMAEEIVKFNENANIFWHHLPANIFKPVKIFKTYDIVYFARLSKDKGVEDFIKTVGLIKKQKVDVVAKVIGKASKEYLDHLKHLTITNNCQDNIEFLGFIPTQKELHNFVSQARVCILPTYNDTVPGTVIESMFLGTAVVTYQTGGIPTLNDEEECVKIVEQGNIELLAMTAHELLMNKDLQNKLIENSRKLVIKQYGTSKAIDELIDVYKFL